VYGVKATDLAAVELADFVRQVGVTPGTTVLEVGSGRGELAAELMSRGYHVVAIDRDAGVVREAERRGVKAQQADFFQWAGGEYDVVIFSRVLHEMATVVGALERTEAALRPGGTIIVDELARDRTDDATAAFFYDTCALLNATGVLHAPEDTGSDDPLMQWQQEYGHRRPRPRPGSAEIVTLVRDRFNLDALEEYPFLYRHIGQWLDDSEPGCAVVERLREVEARRVRKGDIRAMGIRLSARKHITD
jgi:SAM-dependent methyltransferase